MRKPILNTDCISISWHHFLTILKKMFLKLKQIFEKNASYNSNLYGANLIQTLKNKTKTSYQVAIPSVTQRVVQFTDI